MFNKKKKLDFKGELVPTYQPKAVRPHHTFKYEDDEHVCTCGGNCGGNCACHHKEDINQLAFDGMFGARWDEMDLLATLDDAAYGKAVASFDTTKPVYAMVFNHNNDLTNAMLFPNTAIPTMMTQITEDGVASILDDVAFVGTKEHPLGVFVPFTAHEEALKTAANMFTINAQCAENYKTLAERVAEKKALGE